MKRLLKSSGFWTFIIASIVLTTVYKLTGSELLITMLGGIIGIDRAGKAGEDVVKANKGVYYDELQKKDVKV